MKVVLNIDDYCYTKSQIDGTIFAHQNGVITSTTCLTVVRDELLEYGAKKSKENPELGIGCHLTLSVSGGHALTDGKTIAKEDRSFFKADSVDYSKMDPQEVYNEYKAQIERFIKFFGRKPTHLDHHHGLHIKNECLKQQVVKLANEYGIPYRFPNGEINYLGCLYGEYTYDSATKLILERKAAGDKAIELACHCAFVDEELFELSSYTAQRIEELKVIIDPRYKQFFIDNDLERIHY